MTDSEEQSLKKTKQVDKHAAEEVKLLAREQTRRKDTLVREQSIERASKAREAKESDKRAAEEIKQLARDQARRKDTLAREQAIAEDQESRKLNAQERTSE